MSTLTLIFPIALLFVFFAQHLVGRLAVLFGSIVAAFFLLTVNVPGESYRGFQILDWVEAGSFVYQENHAELSIPYSAIVQNGFTHPVKIKTKPFTISSERLAFDYRAPHRGSTGVVKIELVVDSSADSALGTDGRLEDNWTIVSTPATGDYSWQSVYYNLPKFWIGKQVVLSLTLQSLEPNNAQFELRDRVEFFDNSLLSQWRRQVLSDTPLLEAIIFGMGLLLAIVMLRILRGEQLVEGSELRGHAIVNPEGPLFWLILVLMSLIAWRYQVYYYWDEWHVLHQFLKRGFSDVTFSHNEHFLPVFWLFYFAQLAVFGSYYQGLILVSFVLQLLNTFCLWTLLKRLLPPSLFSTSIVSCVLFFYALNPLHAEVLQWAFVQCVLLQHLCVLLALNLCCLFLFEKKKWVLIPLLATVAVAPFIFANGFVLVLQISVTLVAVKCLRDLNLEKQQVHTQGGPVKSLVVMSFELLKFRSVWVLYILFSVVVGLCGYFYHQNRYGAGHNLDSFLYSDDAPFNMSAFARYYIVGTHLGGVLRGFALFPDLAPFAARDVANSLGVEILGGEVFFGLLGVIFSLAVLIFSVWRHRAFQREVFIIWVLAESLLCLNLLLPAIARHRFGAVQSLALRYQSPALLGVSLLFFLWCSSFFHKGEKGRLSGLFYFLGSAYLVYWSLAVVKMWFQFDEFSSRGAANRLYVSKLEDWCEAPRVPPYLPKEPWLTCADGLPNVKGPSQPFFIAPGLDPLRVKSIMYKAEEKCVIPRLVPDAVVKEAG